MNFYEASAGAAFMAAFILAVLVAFRGTKDTDDQITIIGGTLLITVVFGVLFWGLIVFTHELLKAW